MSWIKIGENERQLNRTAKNKTHQLTLTLYWLSSIAIALVIAVIAP